MKQREFPRIKRRINCHVDVEGRRHMGVALDISPKGFFVQTSAAPAIGARIGVTLRHAGHPEVAVQGQVRNKRVVPPRLASVARGGIGIRIALAPEEYYQLLGTISGMSPPAGPGRGPQPSR